MFTELVAYSENLKSLYETPGLTPEWVRRPQRSRARQLIEQARAAGRTTLSEPESKELLDAYGIPVAETRIAATVEEAVAAADDIGYPVVVKLVSHTITHKSDVGGVRLDLRRCRLPCARPSPASRRRSSSSTAPSDFEGVSVQPMIERNGYELILGSSIDPQFGPVLLFGLGGTLVEVFKDSSLGLPPLTATLARRMMERTKIYTALKGVRGQDSVDMAGLEQLLVRFSELVVEQPAIAELDINPLLASPERLLALDARVILHSGDIADEDLPKPAIRPYPRKYAKPWKSARAASTSSSGPSGPRTSRWWSTSTAASPTSRCTSATSPSSATSSASRTSGWCASASPTTTARSPSSRSGSIPRPAGSASAASRGSSACTTPTTAEFSLIIADDYQGHGLGTEMVRRLIEVGREEGLDRIVAEILGANGGMVRICQELGFNIDADEDGETVQAELILVAPTQPPATAGGEAHPATSGRRPQREGGGPFVRGDPPRADAPICRNEAVLSKRLGRRRRRRPGGPRADGRWRCGRPRRPGAPRWEHARSRRAAASDVARP